VCAGKRSSNTPVGLVGVGVGVGVAVAERVPGRVGSWRAVRWTRPARGKGLRPTTNMIWSRRDSLPAQGMRAPRALRRIVMGLDLDQARKQAKELVRAMRSGDVQALSRFRADRPPRLADAQAAVARDLGFRSWPVLVMGLLQTAVEDGDVERLGTLMAHGASVRGSDLLLYARPGGNGAVDQRRLAARCSRRGRLDSLLARRALSELMHEGQGGLASEDVGVAADACGPRASRCSQDGGERRVRHRGAGSFSSSIRKWSLSSPSQCDRKSRVATCSVSSVARRTVWASTRT
jgi:hypothetical protein